MKTAKHKLQGYQRELKEKYCRFGLNYLIDREVLELLLTYSRPEHINGPLADGLLQQFGNLRKILDEPIENLNTSGIDAESAILLKLVRDCLDYYLRERVLSKPVMRCGMELIRYCQVSMAGLGNEQFRVAFLNAQSEITDIEILHEGTLDRSAVSPRKVIERAFYHKAAALIFAHNHVSGNVKPSAADKVLTETLVTAASSVDVEVYDHLIIGNGQYYSFRDQGLLIAA